MYQILFVVGSNRQGSFNKQLADMAAETLQGKAEIHWADIFALPYMNQDIEWPTPAEVARARGEVCDADGIWVFTPEYNQLMPGAVKNYFDWMSRPMEQGSMDTAAKNKPIVMAGAGGRNCALGSLGTLRGLCQFLSMDVVPVDPVGVPIGKGYGTGILTLSDTDRERLRAQGEALLAQIGPHKA